MRECRTSGSVRGVPSNGRPYRNPLEVEGVVDGGMHAQEPLSRGRRFETLHLAIAASHDLM